MLVWGIGAKGSFSASGTMVVMVVVVGRWRRGGSILWGTIYFSETSLPNKLAADKKHSAHNPDLGQNLHPKTTKL